MKMNGKKAKALRRFAEDRTTAVQKRLLVYKSTVSSTIINHPDTTRAVYLDLKKFPEIIQ